MSNVIDRIVIDPDICNGKPVVRGLRITVETILDYLERGQDARGDPAPAPMLEPGDIQACLAFGSPPDEPQVQHQRDGGVMWRAI